MNIAIAMLSNIILNDFGGKIFANDHESDHAIYEHGHKQKNKQGLVFRV